MVEVRTVRPSQPSAVPPLNLPVTDRVPTTLVLSIETTMSPAAVLALAERLRALPVERERTVVCDVGVVVDPDLGIVDALARLALAARRAGCTVRLRGACPQLRALVGLAGLGTVLPCAEDSVVEVRWQPEEREEVGGVQEERDPGDPIA